MISVIMSLLKIFLFIMLFSRPIVEVAANGASENATEEVSETTAAEKVVETENGNSTKEEANGKETETEKETAETPKE